MTIPATPIVTFTTDFGTSDAYVAEMKAMVLREARRATLVDVTHQIAGQDVVSGAYVLERAVRAFPEGTIHVCVVDPGVGSDRKLLIANVNEQIILAPDNGLITWAYERFSDVSTHELLWRPTQEPSATFHGRDILAPVAGLIAAGNFDFEHTRRLDRPVLLDHRIATSLAEARVIYIDRFGNAITNVPPTLLNNHTYVSDIGPIRKTFSEVEIGDPLALVGSSGLLEIAVRNQNAASQLDLVVGSVIRFR